MYIPALETILEYYNLHLYIFYFEPKENLTGNVYFVATFLLPLYQDSTLASLTQHEGLPYQEKDKQNVQSLA